MVRDPDVNLADDAGNTALHRAIEKQSLPIIRMLLRHGADPDATNEDGVSPRQLAQAAGNDKILYVLDVFGERSHEP